MWRRLDDGSHPGAAPGARTLACHGRGGHARRRRALRRFLGRAPAGAPHGPATGSFCAHLQRPDGAVAAHGRGGRIRRRSALSCLAAARGAASQDRSAFALDLRSVRHVDAALTRRLPVPRRSPWRAQLHHLPGELLRGREPASGALLPHGAYPGQCRRYAAESTGEPRDTQPGFSVHAGFTPLRLRVPLKALRTMPNSKQLLYAGSPQRSDELLDRDGSICAHWQPLIEHLADGGAEAVRRSVEMTRRLIVENGVTYNVYADPQGRDRPWQLDPLPLLIAADEWRAIEAGVQQRAQLLNALLADLYGAQYLIAEGVVPAELVFGHPNFLWAAHDTRPVGNTWLHLYAADLARAPDGRWWVLSDRTQTPSGPGYALENRAIIGRVLPGLVNELTVRPLAAFFNTLRDSLMEFADDGAAPLVVVLTPGPFNETYF